MFAKLKKGAECGHPDINSILTMINDPNSSILQVISTPYVVNSINQFNAKISQYFFDKIGELLDISIANKEFSDDLCVKNARGILLNLSINFPAQFSESEVFLSWIKDALSEDFLYLIPNTFDKSQKNQISEKQNLSCFIHKKASFSEAERSKIYSKIVLISRLFFSLGNSQNYTVLANLADDRAIFARFCSFLWCGACAESLLQLSADDSYAVSLFFEEVSSVSALVALAMGQSPPPLCRTNKNSSEKDLDSNKSQTLTNNELNNQVDKEEDINKVEIHREDINREDINREDINREDINREEISREDINKDENEYCDEKETIKENVEKVNEEEETKNTNNKGDFDLTEKEIKIAIENSVLVRQRSLLVLRNHVGSADFESSVFSDILNCLDKVFELCIDQTLDYRINEAAFSLILRLLILSSNMNDEDDDEDNEEYEGSIYSDDKLIHNKKQNNTSENSAGGGFYSGGFYQNSLYSTNSTEYQNNTDLKEKKNDFKNHIFDFLQNNFQKICEFVKNTDIFNSSTECAIDLIISFLKQSQKIQIEDFFLKMIEKLTKMFFDNKNHTMFHLCYKKLITLLYKNYLSEVITTLEMKNKILTAKKEPTPNFKGFIFYLAELEESNNKDEFDTNMEWKNFIETEFKQYKKLISSEYGGEKPENSDYMLSTDSDDNGIIHNNNNLSINNKILTK
ncbi:hypothetical protein TRFO_28781 [Tritrichomonas foetus]|uniref:Uncharacterized protein n=1 Tax=Tritrichomonas foetus TaxID=1144522 RepID=A0A1J4JYW1_9EUKA|nr:hypothetical protein TRFO_28781 [Tritrichomonas foetus]|eukprot:OHT03882.1 hypothetical protein TRFO_28781 [Tritrichomonas foetus]